MASRPHGLVAVAAACLLATAVLGTPDRLTTRVPTPCSFQPCGRRSSPLALHPLPSPIPASCSLDFARRCGSLCVDTGRVPTRLPPLSAREAKGNFPNDGQKGKGGGIRNLFGGADENESKEGNEDKKRKRDIFRREGSSDKKKAQNGEEEDSGGLLGRLGRFRVGDDDENAKDDKKGRARAKKRRRLSGKSNSKLGVSVDINAFVGPRMPDITEAKRRDNARLAAEQAQKRRGEIENARQQARKEAAAKQERERQAAEERKREIQGRQRANRNQESGKKSGNWPSSVFGGGDVESKRETSNSDMKEKDKQGDGVFSWVSGVFSASGKDEEWIVAFPRTQIAPGVVKPLVVGGLDLLVVASRDGKRLACIANSCPHLGTPLETGQVVRLPAEGQAAQQPGVADDKCEDCIICPTHQTAFSLASGEVRGEWCPHPPGIGKMMGAIKTKTNLPTFSVRQRGKNIEIRLNSDLGEIKSM